MNRDKDPMETTHPPGWRCDAHEAFRLKVASMEGDARVMGEHIASIDDRLDAMNIRMDGIMEAIERLAAAQAQAQGGVQFGAWLVPILVGTIIAIAGIAVPLLIN